MVVIQPSIFQVLARFPEQRERVVMCFSSSESFRGMCEDYKQCRKALLFWSRIDSDEAILRKAEYKELLKSLECEILLFVKGSGLIREKL